MGEMPLNHKISRLQIAKVKHISKCGNKRRNIEAYKKI